ncbi:MAG: HpcH/HpaI aldolase/citrate lyase family protein [Xanthobacteraceae bacterium]
MRSLLFVPADSEKKLAKGLESGADALIVDLEDSIANEKKPAARVVAAEFLKLNQKMSERPRLFVRINAFATGQSDEDLDAVMAARPDGIVLPKAEGEATVTRLDKRLMAAEKKFGIAQGQTRILAIATETAASLFRAGTYKGSSDRLAGLTWGAEDLSADLGAEANRDADGNFLDPYRFARVLCLAGATAALVQPIDTVYVNYKNEKGLRREAEEARRDGFTGKLAIHPAQVAIINDVFTPSSEQVASAQAVIDAFAATPGAGVVGINGVMYDRPHLARAEKLLARAKEFAR